MPPASRARARRPAQCVFKEGGRRCIRNGEGNPALCRAHRIAAQVAAEQAQPRYSTAFQQVSELFDDILQGRGVDKKKVGDMVGQAINDFAEQWGMGGGYTDYHPPLTDDANVDDAPGGPRGRQQRRAARGGFRPPPGFRWPPGWFNDEAPIDPELAELEAAAKQARVVLGFGPAEVLTPEILKTRFRALALKHHPDRGGSPDRMKSITAANDVLERWLAKRK